MSLEIIDWTDENRARAKDGGKIQQVFDDFEVKNGEQTISQASNEAEAWKKAAEFLAKSQKPTPNATEPEGEL